MTTTRPVTFLDCTMRDGGYYNDWDYALPLVQRYLHAVAAAGVDVVELGFRTPPDSVFRGPFAYTTDALIDTFDIPDELELAVMSNTGDFRDREVLERYFDLLYPPAAGSRVQLVRLATHVAEAGLAAELAGRLAAKGYRVGVNLMQVGRLPAEQVAAAAAMLGATGALDVLYFADSLGNMRRKDIVSTAQALRSAWSGPLGFHAHDNKRLALDNCVAAAENGCTWIDATIRGMGRGAGNAQTEFLLGELEAAGFGGPYRPDALAEVVMGDFADLQRHYEWGANLLYSVAADKEIHPTYVQELLDENRYALADVRHAVDALSTTASHSFSPRSLAAALAGDGSSFNGSWDATNWCGGRPAMLVASGQRGLAHVSGLRQMIERENPLVLCLNTVPPLEDELIDAYVACHPVRLVKEAARIAQLDRPLLAPAQLLEAVGVTHPGEVLDYGLSVKEGAFAAGASGCEIPELLAAAYAAAAAIAGGASAILLAGFDGYGAGDPRQEAVGALLALVQAYAPQVPVLAVTPTTYAVRQSSVYAPAL